MRNPGESRNKGGRKSPRPSGGGAAGRARQYQQERGLPEGRVSEEDEAASGETPDGSGEKQGEAEE